MTTESTVAVTSTSDEVESLPWEALPTIGSGVRHKVLWRAGDSVAGVMEIDEGGRVNSHSHSNAHHHLWVLEGDVSVHGSSLGSGSYAHVPAGVEHELVNVGTGSCRFMYTYLQP